jgi:hypothetical protein
MGVRKPSNPEDFVEIAGRLGSSHIRGKALQVFKYWKGWVYNLPDSILWRRR